MNYINLGFKDFVKTLSNPNTWLYLGLLDIKLKYRRSIIGPWWEAISIFLVIMTLSFLWSKIFKMDISIYLPYFAISYCTWTYLSNQLNESCEIFMFHQNIIVNIPLNYFSLILRLLTKNTIVYFHYLFVVIPLILFYSDLSLIALYSLLGFFMLKLNIIFLSIFISVFCLRFHDTKYIISNLLQISFFLTPIVWMPGLLKEKSWLMNFNPIYHWINNIREPILNNVLPLTSFIVSLGTLISIALISFYILGRVSKRLPFWF